MGKIDPRVEKIILTNKELNAGIKKAALWLNKNYKNKTPILIPVLKGAIPFYAQLIKDIKVDCVSDFIVYSSFHGGVEAIHDGSVPNVITDLANNIHDKDVIIIEDIIDSGKTLLSICNFLKSKNPKSLKTMVLLNKPKARKVKMEPDFSCFKIANDFIVGFGFDFEEKMRNLPYIGVLKKSIYLEALKRSKNK